ncbi:hypothetical protein AG1IA_03203 [Rhizoctonia solani AG-1 IA]|uniref:Uncharacterized protein n=1 Tax=Thanatephorus cucumeris (strain AG1-IA) TaxID=983506 RepID=L8X193_THACA|nr:hypothetical protein AG1IA_03203 [Rhizoctonia solani AG-1 IA]
MKRGEYTKRMGRMETERRSNGLRAAGMGSVREKLGNKVGVVVYMEGIGRIYELCEIVVIGERATRNIHRASSAALTIQQAGSNVKCIICRQGPIDKGEPGRGRTETKWDDHVTVRLVVADDDERERRGRGGGRSFVRTASEPSGAYGVTVSCTTGCDIIPCTRTKRSSIALAARDIWTGMRDGDRLLHRLRNENEMERRLRPGLINADIDRPTKRQTLRHRPRHHHQYPHLTNPSVVVI